jgi:hypothetical protein
LVDQGLQRLPGLWIILRSGTNLVQQVQILRNLALRIGRVRTLLRSYGLTGDASIAGILAAIYIAVAPPSARIANRTGDAVANRTCLASAGLPALTTLAALTRLLAGLPALTRLPALTGLAIAAELALAATAILTLTIFTLTILTLTVLTLTILRAGLTAAEAGELIAQTG